MLSSAAVGLVLSLALMGLSACTSSPPADAGGEEIYRQICASCHGVDLGGGVGPALGSGSTSAREGDDFLHLAITRGKGRMPSFGNTLSEEQVERLIEYIRRAQEP